MPRVQSAEIVVRTRDRNARRTSYALRIVSVSVSVCNIVFVCMAWRRRRGDAEAVEQWTVESRVKGTEFRKKECWW